MNLANWIFLISLVLAFMQLLILNGSMCRVQLFHTHMLAIGVRCNICHVMIFQIQLIWHQSNSFNQPTYTQLHPTLLKESVAPILSMSNDLNSNQLALQEQQLTPYDHSDFKVKRNYKITINSLIMAPTKMLPKSYFWSCLSFTSFFSLILMML